ncbi:MAG: FAD:protein FMN transferase [Alphaproteobacteria bacterium]|nr:FAD:protein FMN transferase [Alphaproteobacteria bacterium]
MAAAPGLALLPGAAGAALQPRWRWQGTALGAKAEVILILPDEAVAEKLIRLAVDEIERLEDIFSLYRPDSEITRLNRDGRLKAPSPDLVALLSTARHVSELTDGAFDVTVQPLWRLYADHFAKPDADPDGPSPAAIVAARRLVDCSAIDVTSAAIRFARPGMAITLNGIAQGYITDRVADLLSAHGIEHTLIDLGEIRALGARPDGQPWQVAVDGEMADEPIDLIDKAIATSSPTGAVFDRSGRFHHLFDPATGQPAAAGRQISVIAERAAFADALSTALAAMTPEDRLAWRSQTSEVLVKQTANR